MAKLAVTFASIMMPVAAATSESGGYYSVAMRHGWNYSRVRHRAPHPRQTPDLPEHWGDLTNIAYEVAERYPDRVIVVDSSPAWADDYVEFADDGTPIRKPDGVHVCPFGALIFANFLVHWFDDNFTGFEATDPSSWPLDSWSDDRYFRPPTVCSSR